MHGLPSPDAWVWAVTRARDKVFSVALQTSVVWWRSAGLLLALVFRSRLCNAAACLPLVVGPAVVWRTEEDKLITDQNLLMSV